MIYRATFTPLAPADGPQIDYFYFPSADAIDTALIAHHDSVEPFPVQAPMLPVAVIYTAAGERKAFFYDQRLGEYRNVENPHEAYTEDALDELCDVDGWDLMGLELPAPAAA